MSKKVYCTNIESKCTVCSSAYGKVDCKGKPIRGGIRDGAGRPSTGRKKHQYYVTAEEDEKIKLYIKSLRN